MNILDLAIILLIIMSGVVGLKKGALRSFVNFVGTILVYAISFMLKGKIGVLLCKICPFFDFDGYKALNIILYQLIAFIIIASILFAIFGIILRLTGIIQRLIDATIILKIPSSLLGFVVGLLEGYIVMFIIVAILAIPLRTNSIYQESKVADVMMNKSPLLSDSLGKTLSSLSDIFVITTQIKEKDQTIVNQVNYNLMGTYLKYHVISKDDALDIIETGKLDNDSILKEYVANYQVD